MHPIFSLHKRVKPHHVHHTLLWSSTVAAALAILVVGQPNNTQAELDPFNYTNSSNYTYDSSISFNNSKVVLSAVDQTDDANNAEGFAGGTHSDTEWEEDTASVELANDGLVAGTGTFTSRVIDGLSAVNWNTLSWENIRPTNKPLPNGGQVESAYTAGNLDMTDNQLLLHMNEDFVINGQTISDASGNALSGIITTNDGTTNKTTTGLVEAAISFDGVDDGVTINDTAELDITDAITLEAWVDWNDPNEIWYDTAWSQRKEVSITNAASGDLTDFPHLITVAYESDMQADYDDLRFISGECNASGGTLLAHEVEDAGVTEAQVWVNVPSITTATGATVCMYYDNAAAANAEDITGVWDANHEMVLHLNETSGDYLDSTSNDNDAAVAGSPTRGATGKVGGAIQFNDVNNERIATSGALDTSDAFTISTWANLTSTGAYQTSFWNQATSGGSWRQIIAAHNNGNTYSWFNGGSSGLNLGVNPGMGSWHHFVFAYDGDDMMTYRDGVLQNTVTTNMNNSTSLDHWALGDREDSSSWQADGFIDEYRFSTVERSADWVKHSYEMMENQSTYVSFGSAESFAQQVIASKGNDAYALAIEGGNVVGYINDTTVTTTLDEAWSHLALTYDQSTIVLYKNGEAVDTVSATGTVTTNTTDLSVGSGFSGELDELAIYSRALSATEVSDRARRFGNEVKFQVRSCDDSVCDTEPFIGPDGTASTYYTETNADMLGLPTVDISVDQNRYFQYQATLTTNNPLQNLALTSVAVGPTHYDANRPSVVNTTGQEYIALSGFSETLGDNSEGSVEYQLSMNGTDWYYHNGSNWASATSAVYTNSADELSTVIASFASQVGTGALYVSAILISENGEEAVELDDVNITVSTNNSPVVSEIADLFIAPGEQATLDLTAYTTDADNHALTYSVYATTDETIATVALLNGVATITAAESAGEITNVQFSVTDEAGAVSYSDIIAIVVANPATELNTEEMVDEPTNLRLKKRGAKKAKLRWSGEADYYKVQIRTGNNKPVKANTLLCYDTKVNSSCYTLQENDTKYVSNKKYKFRVKACMNSGACSNYTAMRKFRTKPARVQNVAVTFLETESELAEISFDPVRGRGIEYSIQVRNADNTETLSTITSSDVSGHIVRLPQDNNYQVRVRAKYNASNKSRWTRTQVEIAE